MSLEHASAMGGHDGSSRKGPVDAQASLRSLRGGREIRVVRNNRDARLSIGWSIYLSTAKRFSPTTVYDTGVEADRGVESTTSGGGGRERG